MCHCWVVPRMGAPCGHIMSPIKVVYKREMLSVVPPSPLPQCILHTSTLFFNTS